MKALGKDIEANGKLFDNRWFLMDNSYYNISPEWHYGKAKNASIMYHDVTSGNTFIGAMPHNEYNSLKAMIEKKAA